MHVQRLETAWSQPRSGCKKSFHVGSSRLTLKLVRYPMRLLVSLFGVLAVSGCACAQSLPSQQSSTGLQHPDLAQQSAVYVKVQLGKPVKVSALKPGDVIEGKLAQDVYSGDRELFAAGSQVHLTVDKLGRRRRVPNDHWPWVIKAFTPRHENYPTFQSATVSSPDGKDVALRVSLISINRETKYVPRSRRRSLTRLPSRGFRPTEPALGRFRPQIRLNRTMLNPRPPVVEMAAHS